ncbi:MAG: methyltransferase domain-containing protein [Rhodoferax sp.]|jgi:SAM-dependent methyltransferase|nr:methyltransferase domain-containing protein [Rhodoferax sp.]
MKCRICGNEQGNKKYLAKEMMFGYRDEFEYFQCHSCHCLQIAEYPKEMARFYDESYYSYQISKNPLLTYLLKQRNRFELTGKGLIGKLISNRIPNLSLRMISDLLNDKNKSILDVGCGSGKFLKILHQSGFNKLTGIDPFLEHDILIDNSFSLLKKEIGELDLSYDLIFFHHSLEHMPDQHKVFSTITKILSTNGVCVIRIPISSSYAWEHYGVHWAQLDAPRHFYLHSLNSLNFLAASAGLRITKTQYDSTPFQLFASEQYVKDIPMRDNRFNNKASYFDKIHTTKLNLNKRGDQAIFTLSRE